MWGRITFPSSSFTTSTIKVKPPAKSHRLRPLSLESNTSSVFSPSLAKEQTTLGENFSNLKFSAFCSRKSALNTNCNREDRSLSSWANKSKNESEKLPAQKPAAWNQWKTRLSSTRAATKFLNLTIKIQGKPTISHSRCGLNLKFKCLNFSTLIRNTL